MVVLGDYAAGIEEGRRPAGPARGIRSVGITFLGRVIEPLGEPLDGLGDIQADERRALELQAPTASNAKASANRCRPESRRSMR